MPAEMEQYFSKYYTWPCIKLLPVGCECRILENIYPYLTSCQGATERAAANTGPFIVESSDYFKKDTRLY